MTYLCRICCEPIKPGIETHTNYWGETAEVQCLEAVSLGVQATAEGEIILQQKLPVDEEGKG